MQRLVLFFFLFSGLIHGQNDPKNRLISTEDLQFLKGLTESVLESSRIYPGQKIVDHFGPNNTGGVLIRPGGRRAYPSFWIRDYAMSLESGLVPAEEQLHMLRLTAATQCDQTWITEPGALIPLGAIADHVRIDDGLPIYFPGTYSYDQQGDPRFGRTPPYGDQFFFIHMAWQYAQQTSDHSILQEEIDGMKLIDRLELAFRVPPAGKDHLVYTTDDFRGVDFGFRDVQTITGYLCFPSILKVRAAREMADLYEWLGQLNKARSYREMAETIRQAIPGIFMDERGILRASTEKSRQGDVWSTALAVYLNAIPPDAQARAATALTEAYQAGTLAYKGNIRHVLTTDDFSQTSAWEFSLNSKNKYQNGSYWGTPTGWVAYAIAQVDLAAAQELVKAYIDDLRETDYRQGEAFGGPYECFHPETGDLRNPVYLTTVSCPYAAFMQFENQMARSEEELIKGYCLDFNWGEGGPNAFAAPGLWADADPKEHIKWYKDLGVNVIQTFIVSCNGYAWYKDGPVPPQPGLKYDFLPEMVRLGHQEGMKVMGYLCIGSNTRWGQENPDYSYGVPATRHIPYTRKYLAYLDTIIRDAVKNTGIDGFMIDWFYQPERRKDVPWLESEKERYKELMDKPFPGEKEVYKDNFKAYNEYSRRAIAAAWDVIYKAAKETNPDCIIWLTCFEIDHPHIVNSKMFRQVDWLMNEAGDMAGIEEVKSMVGPHTRLITCLADWNKQDAVSAVKEAAGNGVGLYGFAKPNENSLLPSIDFYLSTPLDSLKGDDRNIATFARYYNGLPFDHVKK